MGSESRPGKILLSSATLRKRVAGLGTEIQNYYQGRAFTAVGLMNGSLFFLVDLLRRLPHDTEVECWRIASYQGTKSGGKVVGLASCRAHVKGRSVLLIDDILDTGLTLWHVRKHLKSLGARDVRICVLLEKERKHYRNVKPDWVGFRIPDLFVVGYGLDLDSRYRSLPDIRLVGD